jgi:murein DD-endopeptidase MepM/ murein hydrolase activator NlpD
LRSNWRAVGDSLVALAAVPIDSTTGVSVLLRCTDASEQTVRIQTNAGRYRLEALRVAPRFSAPADSALSERMPTEAERAAAVSRVSHDTPRLWTAPFLAPRPSRITSGFGNGRTFNGAVTSRHMGTDYAGAVGTPVRASNRGIVRLVDAFYLGGNVAKSLAT